MIDAAEAWLTSPDAEPYLAEACASAPRDSPLDELAILTRLRKRLSPDQARLVVEQVVLRRRASAKFSHAEQMFFTAVGLEQATDETIAAYKAARFPRYGRAVDFCCGIGGDLLALGRRGHAVGIDRSPPAANRAAANCRAVRSIVGDEFCAAVEQTDVATARAAACDAWHIDPDRRPAGRRTTHVDLHEPNTATIDALRTANPHGAVKLAPAADLPPAWLDQAECEWISRGGECRQLVAWFGQLARQTGSRRATLVDGATPHTFVGRADLSPPSVERLGRYLYEPDAAVLAAGLVGALAEEYLIAAAHPGCVYLTADRRLDTPLLAAFEVVDEMPFDLRRLRAYVAEHRLGTLEIKKRGIDVDVERLRRELQPSGEGAASLILVRRGDRVTAAVCRRQTARS
jgi:SAM-dependent methyltransferase